jgi:hypothetical protein
MNRRSDWTWGALLVAMLGLVMNAPASAQTSAAPLPAAPVIHPAVSNARVPKIRAMDADNRLILLNRPGLVTVVLGTNEDSQTLFPEKRQQEQPALHLVRHSRFLRHDLSAARMDRRLR